jgi:hypothetical protein
MFPACVGGRCCRLHWPSSTASRSRLSRFYEKPEDWQSAHAMTQLYRSLPGLFDIEKLRPKLRGATTFLELDAILHAWK